MVPMRTLYLAIRAPSPHCLHCLQPKERGKTFSPHPYSLPLPLHKSFQRKGHPVGTCPLFPSLLTLPCRLPWEISFSISLFLQVDSAQPEIPSSSCTHSECLITAPSQLTCHLLREAPARFTLRSELASGHDCHSTLRLDKDTAPGFSQY